MTDCKQTEDHTTPTEEEISLYKLDKIAAIKVYRARTDCGLMESKNALDSACGFI